jgi:hypothetical protein
MATSDSITKSDLIRVESSLKKLIKATKTGSSDPEYLELLNKLTDSINQLRLTVEFDHEQRLSAIEEFLQQI